VFLFSVKPNGSEPFTSAQKLHFDAPVGVGSAHQECNHCMATRSNGAGCSPQTKLSTRHNRRDELAGIEPVAFALIQADTLAGGGKTLSQ